MTLAALFFADRGDHWACRWLRPGFRHVEVALCVGGTWTGITGKLGHLVEVIPIVGGFDPWAFAEEHGLQLVLVPYEPQRRRSLFGLQTCVGVAKAVLGIRAPLCWTPWQLYRRVTWAQ